MAKNSIILCGIVDVFFLLHLFNFTSGAFTVNKTRETTVNLHSIGFQLSPNEIDPNVGPTNPGLPLPNVVNSTSNIAQDQVENLETETNPVNVDDANPINRYCKCTDSFCNCCRDFRLPLIPVRGPACIKVRYLEQDKMQVTIKYGDIALIQREITSRNTRPICIPLPGGYNQFCTRIYGLSRGKEDFKACLGLELKAEDEVEAGLRVSCFKFGSKGLSVAEAEPLPVNDETNEDEDDDEEDGFLGLGGEGDDDDDDDDEGDTVGGVLDDDDDDDVIGEDQADYDGFSLLGGDVIGGIFESEAQKNKSQKPAKLKYSTKSNTIDKKKLTAVPEISDKNSTTPQVKSNKSKTSINKRKKTIDEDEDEDSLINFIFKALDIF